MSHLKVFAGEQILIMRSFFNLVRRQWRNWVLIYFIFFGGGGQKGGGRPSSGAAKRMASQWRVHNQKSNAGPMVWMVEGGMAPRPPIVMPLSGGQCYLPPYPTSEGYGIIAKIGLVAVVHNGRKVIVLIDYYIIIVLNFKKESLI